jgi:hypothetical protein
MSGPGRGRERRERHEVHDAVLGDESAEATADEDATMMVAVKSWVDQMTERGIMVHGGALRSAAEAAIVHVRDGEVLVSHGPFAETKEQIGGYCVVECADLDVAIQPAWREVIALVAEERGFAIPTEASFDAEAGPDGALYVGSPETVASKIAANVRALGATRFDLKYGLPGLTHDQLMTTIELYGQQVVPRVRELLG